MGENMNKKNGFTLIELLVVLIVIMMVFFVATPILLRYVEKAGEGAAKDSMYGYIDAVELASTKAILNDENYELLSGTYKTKDGNLYQEEKKVLNVEMKGTKPDDDGIVTLMNGKITKSALTFQGYEVAIEGNYVEK